MYVLCASFTCIHTLSLDTELSGKAIGKAQRDFEAGAESALSLVTADDSVEAPSEDQDKEVVFSSSIPVDKADGNGAVSKLV